MSSRPITKADFHQIFNQPGREITGFVTCHPDTVMEDDRCINPTVYEDDRHDKYVKQWLNL